MRIVLPGAERGWVLDAMVELGAPSILFSYTSLKRRKDKGVDALRRAKESGAWVMVDSRAAQLRKQLHVKSKGGLAKSLDEEAVKYRDWMVEVSQYVDVFSELDLDHEVGEKIWKWRAMFSEAVRDRGAEILYTPHTFFDFERIHDCGCHLVAVSSHPQLHDLFGKHSAILAELRIRVHGWALTTYDSTVKWPLFSATSNSWLLGSQFGTTYRYAGNCKLRMYSPERDYIRTDMVEEAKQAGVDYDRFREGDKYSVHRFNLSQWITYAKDMETYNINAYWVDAGVRAERIGRDQKVWRTAESKDRHDFSSSLPLEEDPSMDFGRYCNTCFLSPKCPEYKPGNTCPILSRSSMDDPAAMNRVLAVMVELQAERVLFSSFVEKVSGVPLDMKVSRNLKRFTEILEAYSSTAPNLSAPSAKPKGTISGLLREFHRKRSTKTTS